MKNALKNPATLSEAIYNERIRECARVVMRTARQMCEEDNGDYSNFEQYVREACEEIGMEVNEMWNKEGQP